MRGLDLAGGTGRARRYRDTGEIEADHGGLGLQARTANKMVLGNRSASSANTTSPGGLPEAASSRARKPSSRLASRCRPAMRRLGGRAEAGDARDILGARPGAPLLPAAAQQRLETCKPLGQHQRADTLGAADLVRRQRQQVGASRSEIERNLAERLDRIDMQQPAGLMDQPAASATGWIAPVSLLASMIETSAGGAVEQHARRRSRSTTPSA